MRKKKKGFICLSVDSVIYLGIPNTSNKIPERLLQGWAENPLGAFYNCVWQVHNTELGISGYRGPWVQEAFLKEVCR